MTNTDIVFLIFGIVFALCSIGLFYVFIYEMLHLSSYKTLEYKFQRIEAVIVGIISGFLGFGFIITTITKYL